jgi:NAD kinase
MLPIIHYLQLFHIQIYVIEEAMEKLQNHLTPLKEEDDKNEGKKNKAPENENIAIDEIKLFDDESQTQINRIITLGGDGTVVHAIKLFPK